MELSHLDAKTELEQTLTSELTKALKKRGFTIKHNGTTTINAPGGVPDIEFWDDHFQVNVEVTKTTKSSADREYLAIKDHLEKSKANHPARKCFVWYVSPETHYRMINAIREFNVTNKAEPDLKMMPFAFSTMQLFLDKLIHSTKDEYTKEQIIGLFSNYLLFVDDERVLKVLYDTLFSTDESLKLLTESKEEAKHQKTIEELISGLTKLEQDLRDYRIALSTDAIKNVILLVFIKLYEEKREYGGEDNRFTKESFTKYQGMVGHKVKKRAVHELFKGIKDDPELQTAHLFTEADRLSERMNDDFVLKYFIEPFARYHFFTTKVDGLGAAYEVLGKLSGKDVKVGQFFTPENVVRFMVKLADLSSTDRVLDPACGTARFLTYSMEEMLSKVKGANADAQMATIKATQLHGTDDDLNVAKLAKMNMYIHGDGKTNVQDRDGLLLSEMEGTTDVILTNPPLGELTYTKDTYNEDFRLKRMEVIPRKNVTAEHLAKYEAKLEELQSMETTPARQKSIQKLLVNIAECQFAIKNKASVFVTTGNQMKGGALFLNATKHYLKSTRDASALPEWRGGKLLIILDEGVLNTDNYERVRQFIRKYFYIKAVISLSRDTFVPVSNTSTKTSVLYAIKKEDIDATQQEPVFFAHAERVGINTKRRICPNDLMGPTGYDILSKYFAFNKVVLSSYDGLHFNPKKFSSYIQGHI
jgi:type I restriction-modification system DNA methylase subunit